MIATTEKQQFDWNFLRLFSFSSFPARIERVKNISRKFLKKKNWYEERSIPFYMCMIHRSDFWSASISFIAFFPQYFMVAAWKNFSIQFSPLCSRFSLNKMMKKKKIGKGFDYFFIFFLPSFLFLFILSSLN